MRIQRVSFAVCCVLLLALGMPAVRAADEVGTAQETDIVSLSFGKVRLASAIYFFSHMSAFNIVYDPEIIPNVRISVNVTDKPWKALIDDVLAEHDLVLAKQGSDGYQVIPAASSETGGEPPVDWEGAKREHIRLRQIISQGDRHSAILDNFGLVESGSTISAAFGPHIYTWRVKVSADSIALRRHIVELCEPVPRRGEEIAAKANAAVPNGKAGGDVGAPPATQ